MHLQSGHPSHDRRAVFDRRSAFSQRPDRSEGRLPHMAVRRHDRQPDGRSDVGGVPLLRPRQRGYPAGVERFGRSCSIPRHGGSGERPRRHPVTCRGARCRSCSVRRRLGRVGHTRRRRTHRRRSRWGSATPCRCAHHLVGQWPGCANDGTDRRCRLGAGNHAGHARHDDGGGHGGGAWPRPRVPRHSGGPGSAGRPTSGHRRPTASCHCHRDRRRANPADDPTTTTTTVAPPTTVPAPTTSTSTTLPPSTTTTSTTTTTLVTATTIETTVPPPPTVPEVVPVAEVLPPAPVPIVAAPLPRTGKGSDLISYLATSLVVAGIGIVGVAGRRPSRGVIYTR